MRQVPYMLNSSTRLNVCSTTDTMVTFAAENLKKYMEQCLGCTVCINGKEADYQIELKINLNRLDIRHDGFSICNAGNKTVIEARLPRGLLYGAYDFLEKYFHVRFYAPDCEITPKVSQVEIPVEEYVSNPAFPLRGAYNGATRLNKDYYSKVRNHNQFEIVEDKYGGDCGWERVNNLAWATGHNTLCYVEPEIYGETHPEFFAHNRGKITDICFTNGVTDDGKKDDSELSCITIILDYIKRRIAEDENRRYFMIGQTDSWRGFENECVCERCQKTREKYRSSGVLIRFLNIIADEVKEYIDKNYPNREVYIVGFSYSQTNDAPVYLENGSVPIDDTVVCRDNVIMWLCQSGGMGWGVNKQYCFADEKRNPRSTLNYKAWLTLCSKVMLWEYSVNYSEYFWYFPALKMTEDSIRELAKVDCEYYLALFGYSDVNEWQSLLKGYVASKQLWDPTLDYQPLVTEFLEGYYGAGAPYVQRMIDLFENHFQMLSDTYEEFELRGTKSDDVLMNGNYYPKELLDEAESIIEDGIKAIEKAKKDVQSYTARMHCVLLTPMRMRLYNYYMYNKDKQSIFAYFEKFKQAAICAGIEGISEGGGLSNLEWQMNILKELFKKEAGAWDIYRYLYDGVVNNYQLPKRDLKK